MTKRFRIAVDFDGTIVTHEFPDIGQPVPDALLWLKRFHNAGALLFLWTMRSDGQRNGDVLSQAVLYCAYNGACLDGVNESPQDWTTSPKLYAHVYIDDAAACAPLIYPPNGKRPYLDWSIVGPSVMKQIEEYNAR